MVSLGVAPEGPEEDIQEYLAEEEIPVVLPEDWSEEGDIHKISNNKIEGSFVLRIPFEETVEIFIVVYREEGTLHFNAEINEDVEKINSLFGQDFLDFFDSLLRRIKPETRLEQIARVAHDGPEYQDVTPRGIYFAYMVSHIIDYLANRIGGFRGAPAGYGYGSVAGVGAGAGVGGGVDVEGLVDELADKTSADEETVADILRILSEKGLL